MNSKEMGLGSFESKQRGVATASLLLKDLGLMYGYVSFSAAFHTFPSITASCMQDNRLHKDLKFCQEKKDSIWILPLDLTHTLETHNDNSEI